MSAHKILMRKQTEAVVVSCMDFRLQKFIPKALWESFRVRDPDYISVAGGAYHAARLHSTFGKSVIQEDVGLAVSAHGARKIILLNHTDCGRYAKDGHKFTDWDSEFAFHTGELKQAGYWIGRCFPEVDVLLGIVAFQNNRVRIIPVEWR